MGLRGLQSREEVFLLSPLRFHQVLGITHLNERPGHIPNVCSGGHFVSLLLSILPSPCTFSCSSPCPTSFFSGQCSLSCPRLKSLLTPCPTTLQCSLPSHIQPGFRLQATLLNRFVTQQVKAHFSNVIGYIYTMLQETLPISTKDLPNFSSRLRIIVYGYDSWYNHSRSPLPLAKYFHEYCIRK